MAFTKVVGPGIHTLSNILSHNINSSGIITATKFVGPFDDATIGGGTTITSDGINVTGIVTATGLDINGNGDISGSLTVGSGGLDLNGSGDISGNLVVHGNLTANGDFTTLNTTLREVELLRVDADAAVAAGIITQTGAGHGLVLADDNTLKMAMNVGSGIATFRALNASYSNHNGASGIFQQVNLNTAAVTFGNTISVNGATITTGNGSHRIRSAANDFAIEHTTNSYKGFRILGNVPADTFVMNASGNIGIGTATPDSKLNLFGTGSDAATRISIKDGTGIANVVGRYGSLTFQSDVDGAVSGSLINFEIDGSEKVSITSDGRLLLNDISSRAVANVTAQVQLEGTGADTSAVSITRNSANAFPPYLNFGKSRATSTGGTTIIQDDDSLGQIRFSGADGNDLTNHAASIEALVDGTPGNNVTPGRLIFSTTSATGSDATEKFRISSNGQVCIGSGFVGGGGHLTIRSGGVNSYATQDYQYVGTPSDDDTLAQIRFTANTTGASVIQGAVIKAVADADWGASGDAPTRLEFHTAPDGSASMVNRMTITKDGEIGINVTPASGHLLHIKNAGTAEAKVKIESESGYDARLILDTSNGGGAGAHIDFQIDGTAKGGIQYVTNGSASDQHDIIFRNNNYSEKFRINSAGIDVTGEVAASQDYPMVKPTLDCNFVLNKKLDPRIGYTRKGVASFYDEQGILKIVGGNVPRFDHNPETRESLGILIEEERTNLQPHSEQWSPIQSDGWVNVASGVDIDYDPGVVTPTGETTGAITMMEAGASGQHYIAPDVFSATSGTTYTFSFFFKNISGNDANNLKFISSTSGFSYVIRTFYFSGSDVGTVAGGSDSTITKLPNGWWRGTVTLTANNTNSSSCHFDIGRGLNSGAAYNNKVALWGYQVEEGAFATSYIRTGNSEYGRTATRGVDFLQIQGQAFTDLYNPVESTILCSYQHTKEVATIDADLGGSRRVYRFGTGDTSSDTRIDFVSTSTFHPYIARDGSSPANLIATSPTRTSVNTYATRVKENDFATTKAGAAISGNAQDTSGDWDPVNKVIEVQIGGTLDGASEAALQGHYKRFTYYPVGLPNSQLITISS